MKSGVTRQPPLQPLPIDAILPEIVRSLQTCSALVLQASPGSGKTTRVPPALLRAPLRTPEQEILVLEPRRLAAKWAARRVAEEMGEEVGQTVGYHFRFESVGGAATRLRFLTEGMLMRRILSDPKLRKVGAVVLDEFHERHLQGDTALAYLRFLQQTERPDLKIVVMSATLETGAISGFLGECPVLNVDARMYPVEIEHLPSPAAKPLERMVRDAIEGAKGGGGTLVFLPGMAEIRKCADSLSELAARRGLEVLALHGDLSREEQDRAIHPSSRPKVILSTNIAETSLTIEGITTVIDSGLQRQASYSWWSGMPALKTRSISRASAIQRAGRAGRTGPGKCIRLYTRGDFDSRPPFETPEVRRADLSETVLELKMLGVRDLTHFRWFEAPSAQSLEGAVRLLWRLGAFDAESLDAGLTAIGWKLGEMSAHPRIARMLIEAAKRGVLEDAATLGTWISEGDLDTLDALEMLRRPLHDRARKVRSQLLGTAQGRTPMPRTVSPGKDRLQEIAQSVLAGFPDRVARKRKIGSRAARGKQDDVELLFSAGGSSRIEEVGVVASHEMFVVLDVQERQFQNQARAETKVRSVCAIEPDWLLGVEPVRVQEVEEYAWDADKEQVVYSSRLTYDSLVLDESQGRPPAHPAGGNPAVTAVVLRSFLKVDREKAGTLNIRDWIEVLGRVADKEAIEALFARLILHGKMQGNAKLSGIEAGSGVMETLERLISGRTTASQLREIDWPLGLVAGLEETLEHPGLGAELERQLPLSFALPSGRRIQVHYPLGQSPWAESRLQDFFGMGKGPVICGGRVPLTLHLLAPNQRAVQVTSDLAGFWQRSYPEIRNELRRRYPRHAWPDDPLHAQPPAPRPRR